MADLLRPVGAGAGAGGALVVTGALRAGTLETTVVPFEAGDGMALNLHHVTGTGSVPTRGPVILVHGAGVRADIFRPPGQVTIVEALIGAGYDVWLENWRGSADVAPNEWNLDAAAVHDHPAAVSTVLESTGASSLKAVVHCQGSTSFCLAAVAGLLPQVTTIVSNAVALHPRLPTLARAKLALGTPVMARLTPYLDPGWALRPDRWWQGAMARAVAAVHPECDNGVCNMVSFTYGVGNPTLWSHENLSEEVHEWISGQFAWVPLSFFAQISRSVARGHLVPVGDLGLPISPVAGPPLTEARFALFAGRMNGCFLAESQEATFAFLDGHQPGYHSLHVVDGYGHLDMFLGTDAHLDVFPLILEELAA